MTGQCNKSLSKVLGAPKVEALPLLGTSGREMAGERDCFTGEAGSWNMNRPLPGKEKGCPCRGSGVGGCALLALSLVGLTLQASMAKPVLGPEPLITYPLCVVMGGSSS